MKINISSNQIPSNWDDVKFRHFLAFYGIKDFADQLAIFTGLKAETLRNGKIANLEALIDRMAFLNKPMPSIMPKSILGYLVPKDLNFESICRYEDAKEVDEKIRNAKDDKERVGLYADFVAIYAMPNYEDAKPEEREAFAKKVMDAPCSEVMAIGNFTQLKLIELKAKELGIYQRETIAMRRFKLVFQSWRARLVFWVRSFSWRKKPHIAGTNY